MNKGRKSLLTFSVLILLLVFVSLACSDNFSNMGRNQNLAATQESLQQTQVALSVEQTLTAAGQGNVVPSADAPGNVTAAPAENEVPMNLCNGSTLVDYSGVTFCYPASIASGLNSGIAAEELSEMSENFNYPQHIRFDFQGYHIAPTFHDPVIHVYSIPDYETINPYTADIIYDLQTMLQQKPEAPDHIPFLPQWNAAQMFRSQVKYLQFGNGEGVRFLTQYGQSYWPVNNEDLFYAFQGITDDGQYYISAILPISNPDLPANGNAYAGDINDLANTYDVYIENMIILLYSKGDNSYSPTLTDLDDMIRSITVNP